MNRKYFKLYCMVLCLSFTDCRTNILTKLPTAEGKLCIYPERINGKLHASQSFFHYVYLKSGDILIQFDKQEEDCYYYSHLPIGKVFHLDFVENVNIDEYRFKWKNNGLPTRGIYGKYQPTNPDKLDIKPNQLNFFGNYKLRVDYDENKKESVAWNVAGGRVGRSGGAAPILEASYYIIKLE